MVQSASSPDLFVVLVTVVGCSKLSNWDHNHGIFFYSSATRDIFPGHVSTEIEFCSEFTPGVNSCWC